MPRPIVFRPQSGPLDSLIVNLFLNKIQHKYEMEREELRIKAKQAEVKEQRQYTEGKETKARQGQLAEKGFTETEPSAPGSVFMPVAKKSYTRFKPQRYTIGGVDLIETSPGKFIKADSSPGEMIKGYQLSIQDGSWSPQKTKGNPMSGGFADYKAYMAKAGSTKISVGEKQKQEDVAYLNSPKFIGNVSQDVKKLNSFDWELWDENQRSNAVKTEADKRVRISYPGAQYGVQNGKEGWYVKKGNTYRLVVPWSR